MPGSEEFVQSAVHALEAGGLAVWVRRGLVAAGIIALAVYYMWPAHFRGLSTSQGMDQAQIGRAIASGEGWRTKLARPLAVGQLQAHGKDVATKVWIDTYNAPLPPLVDAIALLPVKAHWKMNPRSFVYAGDKAIATMSILLFLGSVAVLYFTARRLFDQRLALLACGLVLLCEAMWQYSLSGLPQMLLLLLFNSTVYLLVRAVDAQHRDESPLKWLAAAGAGFGLLALTHALTLWIFLGAVILAAFFFRPRGWSALIMLAVGAVVYLPWPIRTFIVCGNPGGVAVYSIFDGISHGQWGWMRRLDVDAGTTVLGAFRNKITANLVSQTAHLIEHFGLSVVALIFFVSLLHAFKKTETAAIRWMILAMWGGAVLGMAMYGISEEQGVAANQLHLIFVPLMTCYGLAYLLVQWNRLSLKIPFARAGFIALLYLLCALPMIFASPWLSPPKPFLRWPPYVPPLISVLNDWMKPDEVTASDMPWAVAWYADRRALWLPDTLRVLNDFSDYKTLGGPVNGLYLTPISGTENKFRDIVKGEYRDWALVIQRNQVLEKFPLKWNTIALGFENECIFLSDHDREHPPKQ
ncbi:MAG TPA: glycosyltransferase family 39 protein [Chthoniobacterales bacterium]|nr:glycosyltransferase family 39 protein [Chthoniobacterales bacterium]